MDICTVPLSKKFTAYVPNTFFPHKVSNYNVWWLATARDLNPVSFFFHFKAPFCRTGTTWPANTHAVFFTEVWLTTVAKIRTIASSYWPRKRSVRKFWNDLRIDETKNEKECKSNCNRVMVCRHLIIKTGRQSVFTFQQHALMSAC